MIETLSPRLRAAVSAHTGIVSTVEECLCPTTDPPLFRAACELGLGDWLVGPGLEQLSGVGGIGRTRAAAAEAAVGEALERYSATYVPVHRLVAATAAELGAAAIRPGQFALFSERQYRRRSFAYRRFTETTRVLWVEGCRLPDGEPAYGPAELVFLGPARLDGAAPIGYSTSSGLACGDDVETTLERALCELLERDAFMLVWANRLSRPLLDGRGNPAIARDDRVFRSAGLPYTAVDLSCFHRLPTVLGVVRAPRGIPGAVGVGAAAAPTIEAAWWKALAEAFATRAAGAVLALLAGGDVASTASREIRSFEDHIRRYADHENAGAAAFLDASAEHVDAGVIAPLEGAEAAGRIAGLVRRVQAAGSDAYAFDVTSPDVAALGLTVTRVLTPGLCSLDVLEGARFLGGRRLYEGAVAAGLREAPLGELDVNPDPHPFP